MQPTLVTDAALTGVLEELKGREPIFHRSELGSTRAGFEGMMAPDFWEVGASGRCYTRDYVLAELEKRYAGAYLDRWETRDFHCGAIS